MNDTVTEVIITPEENNERQKRLRGPSDLTFRTFNERVEWYEKNRIDTCEHIDFLACDNKKENLITTEQFFSNPEDISQYLK